MYPIKKKELATVASSLGCVIISIFFFSFYYLCKLNLFSLIYICDIAFRQNNDIFRVEFVKKIRQKSNFLSYCFIYGCNLVQSRNIDKNSKKSKNSGNRLLFRC